MTPKPATPLRERPSRETASEGTPFPESAPAATSRGRLTRWSFLGRVPYREAFRLQEEVRARILEGTGPERLLLLTHPHVYTLGRNATAGDVVASREWLAERGVEVVETDRGGQVTYHGPGQLVGYPVIDLKPDRRDIRRYVNDLQEVLVRTLADFGVEARAGEDQARIGVWAGEAKIASLGIHIRRWVTTHGFALNVTTDLDLFGGIVACGLPRVRMTSIERETGQRPGLDEVGERAAHHFGQVYGRRMEEEPSAETPGGE